MEVSRRPPQAKSVVVHAKIILRTYRYDLPSTFVFLCFGRVEIPSPFDADQQRCAQSQSFRLQHRVPNTCRIRSMRLVVVFFLVLYERSMAEASALILPFSYKMCFSIFELPEGVSKSRFWGTIRNTEFLLCAKS